MHSKAQQIFFVAIDKTISEMNIVAPDWKKMLSRYKSTSKLQPMHTHCTFLSYQYFKLSCCCCNFWHASTMEWPQMCNLIRHQSVLYPLTETNTVEECLIHEPNSVQMIFVINRLFYFRPNSTRTCNNTLNIEIFCFW